jgi:hypothetical protein
MQYHISRRTMLTGAFGASALLDYCEFGFAQSKGSRASLICKEFEAASLPQAVREWLKNSQIVGRGSPSERLRICSVERGAAPPANQHVVRAQQLHELLRLVAAQPGSTTAPLKVDRWFSRCSVGEANKLEFQQPIHAKYANDFVLQSTTELELNFSRAAVFLRVHGHPWMSITGYNPNLTLNNSEIAALLPMASFLDAQARFYNNNLIEAVPFPDTPRLEVQDMHLDLFERTARRANVNPRDYRLHYVRYYVLASAAGASQRMAKPLLAYAYSRNGSDDLRIDFSFV